MTVAQTAGIDYEALIKEDRVHGRLYTDPAIFQEELAKIWYREWVFVGHESEIPYPGDYRTKRLGLHPLLMTRDEDGQVHVLFNRCAHRGNTVCQYERGTAHAFRCAYHGWTYSNRGELLGVPYAGGYDETLRQEVAGLAHVPRVGVYRGFIFASLSPTGISLDEHLGHAKPLIDQFVDLSPEGELVVRAGVEKIRFRANWKMALENAVDDYHANFVHQSAFAVSQQRQVSAALSSEESAAVARDLGNGHTQLDFWAEQRRNGRPQRWTGAVIGRPPNALADPIPEDARVAYLRAMEESYGKERAQQLMIEGPPHVMIFPNLFLINSDIRVIQPISVNEAAIYHYVVLLKGAPPEIDDYRLRLHEAAYGPAGFIIADDIEIWERNQVGVAAQMPEWLLLRRGLHRERTDAEGFRIGHITDEITQRAIWRHYKKLMLRA